MKINFNFFSTMVLVGTLISLCTCERLEVKRTIKIETDSVFNITSNSAKITSEIVDLGETEIMNYGHCSSRLLLKIPL